MLFRSYSPGYFTGDIPPYTSPANMVKIAEYYAEHLSSGTVRNSEQGLRLLVQILFLSFRRVLRQSLRCAQGFGSPVPAPVPSRFTDGVAPARQDKLREENRAPSCLRFLAIARNDNASVRNDKTQSLQTLSKAM